MKRKILVTGGAGFIGSHLLLRLVPRYPDYQFVNLDALTYAGNPDNIAELEGKSNYRFQHGDIRDTELVKSLFDAHDFDGVIHLAAESHVDRSIEDPTDFITTNVIGTVNLLNAAKAHWAGNFDGKLFYHVSTDEVYGSLGATGLFREDTPYDPRSPYSASKASSDHFVRAYYHTYGMPIVMSNCSNNYGPLQFPEKLIPLMIDKLKR
ncbi:MAG: GDP-mannose 4,6-dehydratase, partial [Bacteroidota bacterium]